MSGAETLVRKLAQLGKTFVTAESCTAGLVAAAVADIPGASHVLWGGFIVYTAEAKTRLLGVDPSLIARYGVVSRETAAVMARGALLHSGADIAAAVTGLAGPDGDGSSTPVGAVWIALARRSGVPTGRETLFQFSGSRNEVRRQAVEVLLRETEAFLDAP